MYKIHSTITIVIMIYLACNKIKYNIIMNKIEITVRINLIYVKLIFLKYIYIYIFHVNNTSAIN